MPVYRIPWKKNLRLQHQLYMKRWDLYEKPQRKKKSVIKRLLMTLYLLILFFVTAGVMPPEGDGILRLMVLFIALWVFYNFDRLRHSGGIWLALLLSVPAGWFRKSEEPEEEICFFEDRFEVRSPESGQTYSYARLTRLEESPAAYFLFLDNRGSGIYLAKNEIREEDRPGFREFLETRMGKEWKPADNPEKPAMGEIRFAVCQPRDDEWYREAAKMVAKGRHSAKLLGWELAAAAAIGAALYFIRGDFLFSLIYGGMVAALCAALYLVQGTPPFTRRREETAEGELRKKDSEGRRGPVQLFFREEAVSDGREDSIPLPYRSVLGYSREGDWFRLNLKGQFLLFSARNLTEGSPEAFESFLKEKLSGKNG